jgi:hypothetical protein
VRGAEEEKKARRSKRLTESARKANRKQADTERSREKIISKDGTDLKRNWT